MKEEHSSMNRYLCQCTIRYKS